MHIRRPESSPAGARGRDAGSRLAEEPLSVLHVLAAGAFGGLEAVVHGLAEGLVSRHHRVHVAVVLDPDLPSHPFERELAESGVDVAPLRLPPRAYARERREIAALCARIRPEIVHSHGYRADVQVGAVARRLGTPVLSTVHGFTGGGLRNALYEWLQARALRRMDAVVAVSQPLVAELSQRGVSAERVELIRNAWRRRVPPLPREEARRELGLPDDLFAVGWVGRVSPEKGLDVLLDALAAAGDAGLGACVIGDGPERADLERRAASLGVRVHWCGVRPGASRLYAAFDAFALSSRTEGTPIALFEAMDAGVPVVATAVGGVRDVVGTEHARLVASEDPPALARALVEVRSRPDEAAARARAARERLAAAFGADAWIDRYEQLYRRLAVS